MEPSNKASRVPINKVLIGCTRLAKLEALEESIYILRDLAKPDTSLFKLNLAVHKLVETNIKEPTLFIPEDYKFVIETLEKAIEHLVVLDFTSTLIAIQESLFIVNTSCGFVPVIGELLDTIIAQTVNNIAMEPYIWEGNTTVF